MILGVALALAAFSLSWCAGNKTEITLTGDNNTITTSAATDKKSDTSIDAAGSGSGSVTK